MTGGRITLLLLVGVSACDRPESRTEADSTYSTAAIESARFLLSTAGPDGRIPDRVGRPESTASLGTGAAGRALFLLELHAATADSSFLDASRGEAAAALDLLAEDDGFGLYPGAAGVAFVASKVGAVASDATLVAGADALYRELVAASPGRGGAGWGPVNDVIAGLAGVGLTLISRYEATGDTVPLNAAIEVADTLLRRSERQPDATRRWLRGVETPFDLPNFAHGTAGVGYFLARLAGVSGLERFAAGAEEAERYLVSIADRRDQLFLIPYGVPNEGWDTPHDIGWAHGPAGAARLHYLWWSSTGDTVAEGRLRASARSLLASGAPGPSSDGSLWVGPFPLDQRFGIAGTVGFLAAAGRLPAGDAYAAGAIEMADTILARAVVGEQGRRWSVSLYDFQPGDGEAVFTGFFYGSAGFGLALLEAHHLMRGGSRQARLPDDPFGESALGRSLESDSARAVVGS